MRLFPLPNLVLFPQVVQGLHIFEPRYRELMADALAADMCITLATLCPNWERDYDARPPIDAVACIGRIIQHDRLPDGRFNLRLKGLARVRIIEELPSDKLYRLAQAKLLLPRPVPDLKLLVQHRERLAKLVLPRFAADTPARHQLEELFRSDLPLEPLADMLSYALPVPLDVKRRLLAEERLLPRVELLCSLLHVRSGGDQRFPPEFSAN
ncbi:MAG: LON peptidase substrate-binding domain-containing protein [Gemmataceae bacterium]